MTDIISECSFKETLFREAILAKKSAYVMSGMNFYECMLNDGSGNRK